MNFRIADTFTDSLARLTGEEQKVAKTTAFDLQMDPSSPGLQFHKLEKAKDKNFWSVRVNADVRIIVHKTADSMMLCYVDRHDKAYAWAERRKVETHPKTGAAQLVEIRERVQEIIVPVYVQQENLAPPKQPIFNDRSDEELLGYGVPAEWLKDVRQADEDSLLALADHLPAEAAEALLELATGGKPGIRIPDIEMHSPFDHPDAQRRFRIVPNTEELERALKYPWDKWTIFLHPDQRELVERNYNGPARVSGSAGTGKTIVALHRAVYLTRTQPEARVLLATFSDTLAYAVHTKLRRLLENEPRLAERIEVQALDAVGLRLWKAHFRAAKLAGLDEIRQLLSAASQAVGDHRFRLQFLMTEWEQIVDAWQLNSWEQYRDVARLGRKTRLLEPQRVILWKIFENVLHELEQHKQTTMAAIFMRLTSQISKTGNPPFDFAVIDEAQDLSVSQLRFLSAIGGDRPNALFFAGDLGQRIFQQPFSWKSLGVEVRGRSRTLRVNYRMSHQIRMQADRLLAPEITDIDGNREDRSDTVSVFNGPQPEIFVFESQSEEIAAVGKWLKHQISAGLLPHEIALIVRSPLELDRARAAIKAAALSWKLLDDHVETASGHVALCTMHLAKGLEFRAVAVMACDDEVIPSQERIESVGDNADLQETYDTERQLLYVACTRARDHLLVTSGGPASEFLDDLWA